MKHLLLIPILFAAQLLNAEVVEFIKDGPVHEAYVTQEYGTIVLEAIPQKPPADITETIPPKKVAKTQWISGYWKWSKERSQYVWVSGVWRKPPPGHVWNTGKWEQMEEGYVWLRGFWSASHDLEYITKAPPKLMQDATPPSPGNAFFWVPGYWEFDEQVNAYVWYKGRWNALDPNWLYVPLHYEWRESGYICIPAYWDWPLEERGVAYAAIIPNGEVYQPHIILETEQIIQCLYPCWPSYSCFFYHHYHYHYDFWVGWGVIPPWWAWDQWWGLNNNDMWWLWWWWGNPGFIHPWFINIEFANAIAPPDAMLLQLLESQMPPPFIGPNGVVDLEELIDAIEDVTGTKTPILPSSESEIKEILDAAITHPSTKERLRPNGESRTDQEPTKPLFDPVDHQLSVPPRRAMVPTLPRTEVEKPPVRVVKPKKPARPRTYRPQRPQARPQRPQYTPQRPQAREQYTPQRPQRPQYTPQRPQYTPQRTPKPYTPNTPTYRPQKPNATTPTYTPRTSTPRAKTYRPRSSTQLK